MMLWCAMWTARCPVVKVTFEPITWPLCSLENGHLPELKSPRQLASARQLSPW